MNKVQKKNSNSVCILTLLYNLRVSDQALSLSLSTSILHKFTFLLLAACHNSLNLPDLLTIAI
jgi:hypothetical protein